MLPRVTKVRRLYSSSSNRTNGGELAAALYGTEHVCIVANTPGLVRPRQTVLYLPRGLLLQRRVADALGATPYCRTVTRRSRDDETFHLVAACRFATDKDTAPLITSGIAVPLRHVVRALALPDEGTPATLIHSLHFRRSKPMTAALHVELLDNPSLLRVALNTPLWIAERVRGADVHLRFEAHMGAVVALPDAHQHKPCVQHHMRALHRLADERYGNAVHLSLYGVVTPTGGAVYHALRVDATGTARSFLVLPDEFLRVCRMFDLPVARTLYVNRTLRSVVNARLTRRRPLLAHEPRATRGGPSRSSRSSSSSSSSSNSGSSSGSCGPPAAGQCALYARRPRHGCVVECCTPAPASQDGHTADSSTSWRSRPRHAANETNTAAFDDTRFGGVADDRVDWARCAVLLANQIAERSAELCGFTLQAYTADARFQWLQQFAYMRYRIGAEVLCDDALLTLNSTHSAL